MKILFLASDLGQIGGIQQYNKTFLSTLRDLGEHITLIELKGTRSMSKIIFVLRLIFESIRSKPDVIVCTHINFSRLCYLVRKIFGCRYVVNVYGIDALNISPEKRRALEEADRIIYLFNWTKKNVLNQLPHVQNRFFFLMSCVDSEKFFIGEKPTHLLEKYRFHNSKVILTMTRLENTKAEQKGYRRVIEALPRVLKSVPQTRYVLVGGGDDIPRTKELVRDLHLEDRVVFTGPIEDGERLDYYNLCDVFILPSKGEGCPAIVLLEALACGKPVITGNRECGETDLARGELGIALDPDDGEAIARALIAILAGRNLPKLLTGRALREKSLEMYGYNVFRKRVEDLLRLLKT